MFWPDIGAQLSDSTLSAPRKSNNRIMCVHGTRAAQHDGRTSEQSQQCRDYVVKFLIVPEIDDILNILTHE